MWIPSDWRLVPSNGCRFPGVGGRVVSSSSRSFESLGLWILRPETEQDCLLCVSCKFECNNINTKHRHSGRSGMRVGCLWGPAANQPVRLAVVGGTAWIYLLVINENNLYWKLQTGAWFQGDVVYVSAHWSKLVRMFCCKMLWTVE